MVLINVLKLGLVHAGTCSCVFVWQIRYFRWLVLAFSYNLPGGERDPLYPIPTTHVRRAAGAR